MGPKFFSIARVAFHQTWQYAPEKKQTIFFAKTSSFSQTTKVE
jgi:hypothetical protein